MKNDCPLGFECVSDESAPFQLSHGCANIDTCRTWVAAWELPYHREGIKLVVDFFDTYRLILQEDLCGNPITAQYDWRTYFAEYGFAEAVDLPYFFRKNNMGMMVFITHDSICREEMQKAGYANAVTLPLQSRKEYYFDTHESFNYQEVDLFLCGDEAINALNAGYANAVELLSSCSINEDWEYNSTTTSVS
jgi:hypothetical protein